jgi:DNA-damage-inducible protein J
MSTAVNMFLRQVIRVQGIPFDLRPEKPNAETLQAIAEVAEMKKNPSAYKTYTDVDEMMEDILS